MTRKLTVEEFILKAKNVHGSKYDYSGVLYIDSKSHVLLRCPAHGEFKQTPSHHMMGKGCKQCALQKNGEKRNSNTEEFVSKAKLIHGDKYDYSLVDYKKAIEKVTILCSVHGEFSQSPNGHLGGQGCHYCGSAKGKDTLGTEEFIRRSQEKHGTKYNYSLVEYKTSKDRVKIICPIHGKFEQNAVDHMLGKGCRACMKTGFQTNIPGILYVLSYGNITKVGITNKDVIRRVKEIRKSSGKNFEVMTYIRFKNGQVPDDIETRILKELRTTHEPVSEKFDGSTECFLNVDYEALLLRITQTTSQILSESLH